MPRVWSCGINSGTICNEWIRRCVCKRFCISTVPTHQGRVAFERSVTRLFRARRTTGILSAICFSDTKMTPILATNTFKQYDRHRDLYLFGLLLALSFRIQDYSAHAGKLDNKVQFSTRPTIFWQLFLLFKDRR